MKIAVPFENENIFGHFGHTKAFKIYEREHDNKITTMRIIPTLGEGHGALASFLAAQGVDTLICGGIGGGAKNALAEFGISVYGGVSGNADIAVRSYIAGTLKYDPDAHCDHHESGEEHNCNGHTCGSKCHEK